MLNNIMAIVPGDGSGWAGQTRLPENYYFNNIGEAAIYALIGLLVVFVGIVLIIGIIWLIGFIMRKTNNLEFLTKKREKKAKVRKGKNAVEEAVQATESGSDDIPDEVKAAIVAALMAYYSESEEKCQFTVKRIKRL